MKRKSTDEQSGKDEMIQQFKIMGESQKFSQD